MASLESRPAFIGVTSSALSSTTGHSLRPRMPSSLPSIPGTATKWATITRLLPGRTDNAIIKNHWNSTLHCRSRASEAVATTIASASLDAGPASVLLPLASNSIDPDKSNSESAGKRPCRRDEVSGSEVMTVIVVALPVLPPPPWPPIETIMVDLAMSLTLSLPGEGGATEGDGGGEQKEEFHQQTAIEGQRCSLECLKVVKT